MDERELVKKAIADTKVPLTESVSDEDLKRYNFGGMPIVANNSMPMGEVRVSSRGMRREYLYPRGFSERQRWDELTLNPQPLRPEKWASMDWGSSPWTPDPEPILASYMSEYMRYVDMVTAAGPAMFGIDRSRPQDATAVLEPPSEIPRPSKDILKRFAVTDRNVTDMRGELAAEAEALLGYSVLRKRLGMQSPLTSVLLKLEIEPFDGKTVDEYKKQMLAYAQNEAARMDVAEGINPRSWQARAASWRSFGIKGYSKPIPEFAIEKALQIKKACPEVNFEIEELTVVPDPFLIAVLGKVRRYIEVWDEPKFEG